MGLLDGILGSVLGGGSQQGNGQDSGLSTAAKMAAIAAIYKWVQSQGGFEVLLQKLQQGGLGGILGSWLGQGDNAPVETSQLQSAFGHNELQSLADMLGTNTEGALSQLQQFLPGLIDHTSPNGEVDESRATELKGIDTSNLGNMIDGIFGKK